MELGWEQRVFRTTENHQIALRISEWNHYFPTTAPELCLIARDINRRNWTVASIYSCKGTVFFSWVELMYTYVLECIVRKDTIDIKGFSSEIFI